MKSNEVLPEPAKPRATRSFEEGALPMWVRIVVGLVMLCALAPKVAEYFEVSSWSIIVGTVIVAQLGTAIFYLHKISRSLERRRDR